GAVGDVVFAFELGLNFGNLRQQVKVSDQSRIISLPEVAPGPLCPLAAGHCPARARAGHWHRRSTSADSTIEGQLCAPRSGHAPRTPSPADIQVVLGLV